MTAIAYAHGKMACDSLCADTASGAVFYKANKITRNRHGALIGCSGISDARAFLAVLDNVKCSAEMPMPKVLVETRTEASALMVFPDGDVWVIDVAYSEDTHEGWWATADQIVGMGGYASIGCGGDIAMAAMKSGKSARQAIAIACQMNVFCAPPIYEEALHPVIKAPRRGKASKSSSRKAQT